MSTLERLLRAYPPEGRPQPPGEGERAAFAKTLPPGLLALFTEVGCAKLGDGLFELVDPAAYGLPYADFFGGGSGGRVPFLLNAFGEVVAAKRIGARETELSILHTYGPKLEVLAYDVEDFFDRVMLTDDGLRQLVNVNLFGRLRGRLGRLRRGRVYGFDPALLAEDGEGAKADASYFEVVDAREHLSLLLRRAAADE